LAAFCKRCLYLVDLYSCFFSGRRVWNNRLTHYSNLNLISLTIPPYKHICGCVVVQYFTIFVFKCWILLKPVLGGVDGSLNLTVQFMNRLNQTEPATFSILACWGFFRDSNFFYLT
jgi:hypothetical protein